MESEWECGSRGERQGAQPRIRCMSGERMSTQRKQRPHLEKSYFEGEVFPLPGARGPSAGG
jgi:hypothetical protein